MYTNNIKKRAQYGQITEPNLRTLNSENRQPLIKHVGKDQKSSGPDYALLGIFTFTATPDKFLGSKIEC